MNLGLSLIRRDMMSESTGVFVRKYGLAIFLAMLAILLFLLFSGYLTGK